MHPGELSDRVLWNSSLINPFKGKLEHTPPHREMSRIAGSPTVIARGREGKTVYIAQLGKQTRRTREPETPRNKCFKFIGQI